MDIEVAVNLAIDNVITEGLNDIFPRVFEETLLKDPDFRKRIFDATVPKLKKTSIDEMDFGSLQYSYFPKKEAFDFRKAASIQPWDLIKYLSLTLLCAEEIEKNRPAPDKNIVFSYRFQPNNGYLFNPIFDFKAFQKSLSTKIKNHGYKLYIKADIANYYDRLNLHRLENVLLSYYGDRRIVKLINQLLFFWSNKDSYGLPVGSNASRILAEAELIEVDNYLLSKDISFVRYVDDYKIFANHAKEAHYFLNLFIARLSLEGLSVNTGKTSIEKAKDYSIDENSNDDNSESEFKNLKDFVTDNKETQNKIPSRLIVGYSGLIPTKFRQPSLSEIKSFQNKLLVDIKSKIINEEIIKPEAIRDFVKFIAINSKWDELGELFEIMDKFPQFTPYISDMLIKFKDKLPVECISNIKSKYLLILLSSKSYPEYIYISAVTVLTEPPFASKIDVLNFYRDMRRSTGSFIGRFTLDQLEKLLTRGEIIEIKNEFDQVGLWEKRIIIKIVKEKLEGEESRPWLKNIKTSIKNDPFSLGLI